MGEPCMPLPRAAIRIFQVQSVVNVALHTRPWTGTFLFCQWPKKKNFCGCLFLLSVWLSVARTKPPLHFVLWLKNPSGVQLWSDKTCSPCPKPPGNAVHQHAAAHGAQKPCGLSPKVCNFLTQQHTMLLKPYLILIYAIKARYATSKDATTLLSTSGC